MSQHRQGLGPAVADSVPAQVEGQAPERRHVRQGGESLGAAVPDGVLGLNTRTGPVADRRGASGGREAGGPSSGTETTSAS